MASRLPCCLRAPNGKGERRVRLPTGRNNFTDKDVTYRLFAAAKDGLKTLDLLEEIPGKQNGPATRFRATPQLKGLAAQHGIQPGEADKHFVLPLPKHTPSRTRRNPLHDLLMALYGVSCHACSSCTISRTHFWAMDAEATPADLARVPEWSRGARL
jgi:hypothetical protein